MTDSPRVSVCLLAYNHATLIEDSIRSVLAQDESDFELIISDDCSRDTTWEVLQRIAATDQRVKPIRPHRNLGMAGNANFAAGHAKAPYIALLHHDDIYDPSLLRKWVDVADRHPNVAFVSNDYGVYGSSEVQGHPFPEVTPGRKALESYFLPVWGFPVRGTALIRKSRWDEVGGIREQFGLLADIDLWMRLARKWDFGYVNEPLIVVRQERPEDYPDAYKKWSWARLRTLYEIHGINRDEYYDRSARGRWERQKYRLRVSWDESYWLLYGVAKRRPEMLLSSPEIANAYELKPVRLLRKSLRKVAALVR